LQRGNWQSSPEPGRLSVHVECLGLVKDRKTDVPATAETKALPKKYQEYGLVIMSCGPLHNVFRFDFPLVITEEELTRGFDILEDAIREVNATI
jgi:4-aminobutyrate aminotransferase/(S)-3-amino-2-methylpropionate transaminase